ncbi:MAG: tRNA pseudouridine(38-40) synthase TruA [Thermodesulfobacteriota bacterium]
MRAIKLTLAYDGTDYAGWQRQEQEQPTIQGVLEEALARMTDAPVILHGAGRTDAGVHARGMVAHFHTRSTIPPHGLLRGVNSMLPRDIRVMAAENVAIDFHARYNATGKRYIYSFLVGGIMPPLLFRYAAWVRPPFAMEAVRQCLPLLIGTHDFSSFEATGSRDRSLEQGRGAVRTILEARLDKDTSEPGLHHLAITGDGFLRHMVRNIAGTLFEVGAGRIGPGDFAGIIAARDRTLAGPTAPACGLVLDTVLY